MGSGSWLLAQITGPAKDNGKGGFGLHPELFKSSKVKVFLSPATLPDRKVRKPERAPAPLRRVFLCHDHGHES